MNADDIIRASAACYGITPQEILQRNRQPRTVRARRLAMALCRSLLEWSYAEIGLMFRRDHGTVIHACRRMSALLAAGGTMEAYWFLKLRTNFAAALPVVPPAESEILTTL